MCNRGVLWRFKVVNTRQRDALYQRGRGELYLSSPAHRHGLFLLDDAQENVQATGARLHHERRCLLGVASTSWFVLSSVGQPLSDQCMLERRVDNIAVPRFGFKNCGWSVRSGFRSQVPHSH